MQRWDWLDRYTFGKRETEWRLIFVGLFIAELLVIWLLQSQCAMVAGSPRHRYLTTVPNMPGGSFVQCLAKSPDTFLLNWEQAKKSPLGEKVAIAIVLPVWLFAIPYMLHRSRKNREAIK